LSIWHTFWVDPKKLSGFKLSWSLLARASAFARHYRAQLLAYLLVTTAGSILGVLPALIVQRLVDHALAGRNVPELTRLVGLLAIISVLTTAEMVVARWLGEWIGNGMTMRLRIALYDHFQRMPLAFFTRAQTGMIQSRLMSDVRGTESLFTETLSSIVTDVFGLVATLVTMSALSVRTTLAALVLVPVLLLPAELVGRRVRRLNQLLMKQWGDMNTVSAERLNVAGSLLVKLFGGFQRELDHYGERAGRVRTTAIRQSMIEMGFVASLSLVGSLAVVAVYLVGGLQVIAGALSLGTVVALATLVQRVYGPTVDLASSRINLVSGLVAFERVFEVLGAPHLIANRPGAHALPEVRGEVELRDVWFRYPAATSYAIRSLESDEQPPPGDEPSGWILRDIAIEAAPGTVTALVGPSGVGKTTLCYLLARLYDVTEGSVRIDGYDVRDLTLETIGRAIAMVTQDPHLFHESIAANLRYARPGATDEDIVRACRAARIHERIATLPEGYGTVVGERGYRFSGGEKQRLAIARAILKDPAILILDEATSHLDTETEALVQEALEAVMRGRTSFVIAHRLSTVRRADQIVVLDGGRVVQRGRHADLLRAGGLYADLYDIGLGAAPNIN
jgi:ATP-binding cassette subfamily B protein